MLSVKKFQKHTNKQFLVAAINPEEHIRDLWELSTNAQNISSSRWHLVKKRCIAAREKNTFAIKTAQEGN